MNKPLASRDFVTDYFGMMNSMNGKRLQVVLVAAACWLAASTTSSLHGVVAAERPAVVKASKQVAIETIRERFPDGRLKIEREVTTDTAGNYVNHGAWRMWNADGQLVAEGRYDLGQRSGRWMRQFNRDEAEALHQAPFDQFEAPFVARATFKANKLDGEWSIVDAQHRKCSSVALKHGKRYGPATLWLPDGTVYREATFRNGSPVGDLRERVANGELQTTAMYVGGQQLVNKVTYFPESQIKQSEATCLVATIIEVAADDFWHLRFAEYKAQSEEFRHGDWRCWYSNGRLQAAGFFQYDREAGTFTWWHAHGQEAVKGGYADGQPDGVWTWWHANGQKAASGRFQNGQQVGIWQKWAEDGRLVQRIAVHPGTIASSDYKPHFQLTQQAGAAEIDK